MLEEEGGVSLAPGGESNLLKTVPFFLLPLDGGSDTTVSYTYKQWLAELILRPITALKVTVLTC